MKPEDIIKYVALMERVDYGLLFVKGKSTRVVATAKYRAMYLIHYFYPKKKDPEVAGYFNMHRCSAIIAYKEVSNGIACYKPYDMEMRSYIAHIRKTITRVNNKLIKRDDNTYVYKMENKRVILHKNSIEEGFMILLKSLNGRKVEKKYIVLSDEAMSAIVQSYHLIN